jgi:hypothetical protein
MQVWEAVRAEERVLPGICHRAAVVCGRKNPLKGRDAIMRHS